MNDVGMTRRIGAAMLVLLLVTGLSCAVNMRPGGVAVEHKNTFEQDVSGEGYVMVYQYVNTNNLSVKNYMHGSGIVDMATLIYSEQKPIKTADVIASNGIIYTGAKADDSYINFTKQAEMAQSPYGFAYGTGWYAQNPIKYNSLLKERTEGKNWQAGAAMVHQIEYAKAFKEDLNVYLNCTGETLDNKGVGQAKMAIDEEVSQGTVHIGQILVPSKISTSGGKMLYMNPKDPLILIDENYVGNFKIKKNMDVNVPKPRPTVYEDWLPCCFGGFFDMYSWDQKVKKAATGIFDCTCRETALKTYKPSWNGTVAQFPAEEYMKKP